ncbi:MAG: TIGR03617 family F420-dependent LLM class oxidoreductase [Actinomycetes bacterium]
MRIDVAIMDTALANVPAKIAKLAELGVSGVFTAEGPHDPFAALFLATTAENSLDLMTNAAIAFPRNPIHLAHTAFDLQALSGGRFRLGIAPQVGPHISRRFGLEWSKPVARMEDFIAALKAIFATWSTGAPLKHEGPFYKHTLMTPMFTPPQSSFPPPPIVLGALGPQMTELAGKAADGLTTLPFMSKTYLEEISAPAFMRGLANSGRSRSDVEVVTGAIVAVASDHEELEKAIFATKGLLGFYASTKAYRPVLESIGEAHRYPEFAELARAMAFTELAEKVSDKMLSELAVVGSPKEVAAELQQRFGWYADRLAVFFPHAASDQDLAALCLAFG